MSATQVVPPPWRVMTLADLGAICTSGSRGWASRYVVHGHLFVRITNLRRSSIHPDLSDSRHVAVDPSEPEARRTRLQIGDVLISITADIGIIGYVDATIPDPAYINQHIARVRLDPKRADSRFVAYYLASWGPQRGFVGSTDTGAKAGMNLATVARLETVVPPLPEQRAIAAALADADEQIEKLHRLISKKQAIKQGMMQELLTGQTRLPGFGALWRGVTVADLAEQHRSTVDPRRHPDTTFQHFSLPAFDDGERPAQEAGSSIDSIKFLVPPNAVLVAKLNPRIPRIWAPEGIRVGAVASTEFIVMTARPGAQRSFFKWLMKSDAIKSRMKLLATGTTGSHARIHPRQVAALEVNVPDVDEQSAISRVLDDVDGQLALLSQRLTKVKAIKQGMMQELLTGQARLPVEASS